MSAFWELLRPLKPGEERVTYSTVIPNGTRELITERVCADLVDELRDRLGQDPAVEQINYGPKILRETNSSDGKVTEMIVTAFAIVQRRDTPIGSGPPAIPR